jgi:prephenate dehydrogenase
MVAKKIGIIGYGRFGRMLHNILAKDFTIAIYDTDPSLQSNPDYEPLASILKIPTIFLCVPISKLDVVLADIGSKFIVGTIIDVCSVKKYPVELMQKYLASNINIIATHPMFGPDSFFSDNQKNMMMCHVRGDIETFDFWREYFTKNNIHVQLMTPDEHDRAAAYSQNITHVLGRALSNLNLQPSVIATQGYNNLLTIVKQTCNDSLELFHDMLHYNPYSADMLQQLQNIFLQAIADFNKYV